ncbi:MAG: hypothetical protein ABI721_01120 [Candidatus Dojkabacteria bacterium]
MSEVKAIKQGNNDDLKKRKNVNNVAYLFVLYGFLGFFENLLLVGPTAHKPEVLVTFIIGFILLAIPYIILPLKAKQTLDVNYAKALKFYLLLVMVIPTIVLFVVFLITHNLVSIPFSIFDLLFFGLSFQFENNIKEFNPKFKYSFKQFLKVFVPSALLLCAGFTLTFISGILNAVK